MKRNGTDRPFTVRAWRPMTTCCSTSARGCRRTPSLRAAELAAVAVFLSKHGDHAARAALEAGMAPSSCHHIPVLARAADFLKSELRDDDLVLVKGRSTDHLSRVIFAQYGSIGCWTTTCRIHRTCDVCPLLQPGFDLDRTLSTKHASSAGPRSVR